MTVAITYRLGVFGYLQTNRADESNVGLQDQLAALKWVRENIAAFGGDPDCITVCGQSAGARSIAGLLAVDGNNLLRRAILQSMPGIVTTESKGRQMRNSIGSLLDKPFHAASSDEILGAQKTFLSSAKSGMSFGPVGIDIRPQPARIVQRRSTS